MADRFARAVTHSVSAKSPTQEINSDSADRAPFILLLPGSREDEVRRHWPVITRTFELLRRELPTLRGKVVLPHEALARYVRFFGVPAGLDVCIGGLNAALPEADLAITKSGTITVECALHGLPAVVFYQTSWTNFFMARQIVQVKYIAMPNLLVGEEIYPEFVQDAATPENIARAALELLNHPTRRATVKAKLAKVVASLDGPGASQRAAEAIVSLLS